MSSGMNRMTAATEEVAEVILEEAMNSDPTPIKLYKIAKKAIGALFAWFNCRHRRAEKQRKRELSALEQRKQLD